MNYSGKDSEESYSNYKESTFSKFKKGFVWAISGLVLFSGTMIYDFYSIKKGHDNFSYEVSSYVRRYDLDKKDSLASKYILNLLRDGEKKGSYVDVDYYFKINELVDLYEDKSELVNFVNKYMIGLGADFFGDRDYDISEDELDYFHNSMRYNAGYATLVNLINENISDLDN